MWPNSDPSGRGRIATSRSRRGAVSQLVDGDDAAAEVDIGDVPPPSAATVGTRQRRPRAARLVDRHRRSAAGERCVVRIRMHGKRVAGALEPPVDRQLLERSRLAVPGAPALRRSLSCTLRYTPAPIVRTEGTAHCAPRCCSVRAGSSARADRQYEPSGRQHRSLGC
jgi:hypothetical protein